MGLPCHCRKAAGSTPAPYVQLYDLETDPDEFADVANDPAYAEVLARLDDKLWAWMEELDDPLLQGPTPTPYYRQAIAAYRDRER